MESTNMESDDNLDTIEGDLFGQLLKNKYVIGRLIDQGSYGKVYKAIDIEDKHKPLVVKIAQDYKTFGKEINAMRKVH